MFARWAPVHWRALLLGMMVVGIAWAVRPLAVGQGPENWFPSADKVHHLWFFALLFWVGHRAALRPTWALALGLVAYGLSMEFAQSLTPSRSASLLDLVADGLGIASAWLWCARSGTQPAEHSRQVL
jgi:VanZ family protein